ncbi:hypothetical protein RchiOBHm_Chr3g0487671 [Rosa chinensis]|uniref:Uncharacterized protein n=1 Tax=Rosa chinensis TaxID=74649 RepID=A0A2P6RFK0_ROSCH|nr:hypothetical protein RchiOBHm_Chr3g0487671 [Rosa chinensis]
MIPLGFPATVANYMMSGETHTTDYMVPDVNGNGPVDNYGYENIMEDPAQNCLTVHF